MKRTALRHFILLLVSLACALALAPSARATVSGLDKEHLTLSAFYTTYSNLSLSGTTGKQLPSSIDMELTYRLYTIFNLAIVYNDFQTPSRPEEITAKLSGPGIGMIIDLPGFFFIGGQRWDNMREAKAQPVNTYLFGQVLKLSSVEPTTGASITVMTPKYGFGTDVFLLGRWLYITARLEMFSYNADAHLGYSGGLGLSF